MSDPVEFIERKLAMVDKEVSENGRQVQKLFQRRSDEDEPLYCIDDDYHHPLTGDPLTIIALAAATRALLELHERHERPEFDYVGGNPVVTIEDGKTYRHWPVSDGEWQVVGVRYECGHCIHPDESYMDWPCPTIKELAKGWGWTEEESK